MSLPPTYSPPLTPEHQRDAASLQTVDLERIRQTHPPPPDETELSERDAMYAAYTWSEAKHDGRGPESGPTGPGYHDCELVGGGGLGVQYRVYLNTTVEGTRAVSEWLKAKNVFHKRGSDDWAANRRDAIIMYVKAGNPSLEEILDALAVYQGDSKNLAGFVNERVRLTRPAVVRGTNGPLKLVGVGIADEVLDTTLSFSSLAADAVLSARKKAQTGPGTFQRHLAEALELAGRAPGDPSREHYVLSVGGQRAVVQDRYVTGATIMSAAGIDSTTHDLVYSLRRITAGDSLYVRRGDKFLFIDKDAPIPRPKPPKVQT